MFCPKCGSTMPDGATFCGTCGTPVSPAPSAGAPGGYPGYPQPRVAKIPRPNANIIGGLGVFGIVKAVALVVLAICLFMPWFQISIDGLIDATNAQTASYGGTTVIPKLGAIGISVFSLGDSLNSVAQVHDWMAQATAVTGTSSSTASMIAMLGTVSGAALPYRIFGLLWIASILFLVAGATMSFIAKQGDKVLQIAAIICAVTSLIGIIIAVMAAGQANTAIMGMLGSSLGSYSTQAMAAMNNMFSFTPAPIIALIASVVMFVGSMMEKQAR